MLTKACFAEAAYGARRRLIDYLLSLTEEIIYQSDMAGSQAIDMARKCFCFVTDYLLSPTEEIIYQSGMGWLAGYWHGQKVHECG